MEKSVKIGILCAGLLLIFISAWYLLGGSTAKKSSEGLGWIEHDSGEVSLLRAQKAERVQSRVLFFSGDSIQTDENGGAMLQFQDGSQVKVLSSALVTVENLAPAPRVLLVLKRGDLRVDQVMNQEQFFISKNGQRVAAEKYESLPLFREPTLPEPGAMNEARGEGSPPSEKEIGDQFAKNKSAFFKCFGQILQKKPQAKGEVSLSFVIVENGKVTQTAVQVPGKNPDLKDPVFEKCLIDVVTRMSFNAFRGPAVSTFYPLKFD